LICFGFVDPRLKPWAIFIGAFRAKHFPTPSARHLCREWHQTNFQLRQEQPISLLTELGIFSFRFYKATVFSASPDGLENPERIAIIQPGIGAPRLRRVNICKRHWSAGFQPASGSKKSRNTPARCRRSSDFGQDL
jgi:hypothetical protein